jgi:hypothetical protein
MLLALPSNEKNSFNHHNSYNKGPNLAFFSFIATCPKQQRPFFGHQRALGIKVNEDFPPSHMCTCDIFLENFVGQGVHRDPEEGNANEILRALIPSTH